MDSLRWSKKTVRILGAQGIQLAAFFDPTIYELVIAEKVDTSATGLLRLFELHPLQPDLPAFAARWDDGDKKVDVDLLGDDFEREKFKAGSHGYSGHHSALISQELRQHRISISIPSGRIFEGEISLNLNIAVNIAEQVRMGCAVDA